MSEFKFNQPERHNVERLLQQVRHMGLSVIEGVDRIEQIISPRGESDGWVRIKERLPTKGDADRNGQVIVANIKFTQIVDWDFVYIDMFDYWMGITPLPSPPKSDQQ